MASSETIPAGERRHLGDEINAETRSFHTRLNKLIISRLPLAIPPLASNPSTYVSGLLHVAPIYIAFESLWQNVLQPHDDTGERNQGCGENEGCEPGSPLLDLDSLVLYPILDNPRIHKPLVCDRVHSVLSHLHLPGMLRSSALRSDIGAITGWPEHVVEEQLKSVVNSGQLQHFISSTKRLVEQRPHVLLAYAWVFYMALFSGGKFIRGSLETAGSGFWSQHCDPVRPSMLACERSTSQRGGDNGDSSAPIAPALFPLEFFRFDTPSGGEDLKLEFKRRLTESETLLTPGERQEIVQEAVRIFDNIILLVMQLDGLLGTPSATNIVASADGWARLVTPRLGGRVRDSVVVAKERNLRHSSGGRLGDAAEKRARSSTTNSVNSVHVEGTLTPMAELLSNLGVHDPQSKTVRFERKLAVPVRKTDQQPRDTVAGTTDGAYDDEFRMAIKSYRAFQVPLVWNHVLLFGMVAAFLGCVYVAR